MIAIVSYLRRKYGCQMNGGRMVDWESCDEVVEIVDFAYDPRLSTDVKAIKSLKEEYQWCNSFTTRYNFEVIVIPSI